MLSKLFNRDYRYCAKRKVIKLLRARVGGVDVFWERYRWRSIKGKRGSKKLVHDFAQYAFWGEVKDRVECVHQITTEEERHVLVAKADSAVQHDFDLLGSGKRKLGADIDWHQDLASEYRWSQQMHYSQCRWDDLPEGVDIKGPWELSRCMHFAGLGLADWATGDTKYFKSYKEDIQSWIKGNAFERGVNWACPMDVALRAVNWLNAAQLFQYRIREDEDLEFYDQFTASLWLHGRYIFRNLEWSGPENRRGGNHFLANLLGLLVLGLFFSFDKQGRRWWDFAKTHLEDQMIRQVNPDGTNFETSTSYHRLVLEMFLWADSLAERVGKPFSGKYKESLSGMIAFVEAYSDVNELSPQFGDNDSGRVIWTGLGNNSDHRYLTDSDECFGGKLHRFLLRGTLDMPFDKKLQSSNFPDGGCHFLRSKRAFLGVRAGLLSQTGGHSHCDQLSFVFSVGGSPIFVDRGTGTYTSEPRTRNLLRSTRYHSTPQINGWEQNSFSLDRMRVFGMRDDTQTKVLKFEQHQASGLLVAEHRGFQSHRKGLVCKRSFQLDPEKLVIKDEFSTSLDGDLLEWNFHLAPGIDARIIENSCIIGSCDREVTISWAEELQATLKTCQHSPEYGEFVPAQSLCLSTTVVGGQDGIHSFLIMY